MDLNQKLAPCLMLQGTSSHVGKSVLATAFCRIFARMGYRVAPFKSQNMANNSYVTREGLEIGRAQAAQAEAAGVESSTSMNPILLKPSSDGTAQIVLNGKPVTEEGAWAYRENWVPKLWCHVQEALQRLRTQYDVVVIEGAGSPSEVNLKDRDIANMRVAMEASAHVILVGDIEKGGMLASIVGTLALLPKKECDLITGIIVNKFRGDKSLLDPGLEFLENKTHKPVLGVLPYIQEKLVEEEDSVALTEKKHTRNNCNQEGAAYPGHEVVVGVVHLPRISNFTDFEPLERHPQVTLKYCSLDSELARGQIDCLIIPGTKATINDYLAFVNSNLFRSIKSQNLLSTLPILGICGGYQMLGSVIEDPQGVEGAPGRTNGLNLLPVTTAFHAHKSTEHIALRLSENKQHHALFSVINDTWLQGYEIHMGQVEVKTPDAVWLEDSQGNAKGACSPDHRILGTYLHDIFSNQTFVEWFINWVQSINGNRGNISEMGRLPGEPNLLVAGNQKSVSHEGRFQKDKLQRYDKLADYVACHVDIDRICQQLGLDGQ